jgi:S1-C subfamily serine protease
MARAGLSQILPKTLAGLAVWILMFASGIAASGVVLFFYYNYKLESIKGELLEEARELNESIKTEREGFEKLVKDSTAAIEKAAGGAAESRTNELNELLEKVGPSIARVQGKAMDGTPTSGSGFIVTATGGESWVLTNFHLVAGAIAEEAPVAVRVGENERDSLVYSWDQQTDLALVILRVPDLPAMTDWNREEVSLGTKVWAVGSAPGRFGSAASQGFLLDWSEAGLLADADVPRSATGGPLLDESGKVLGVLSLSYAPEGYAASNGWAVPIQMTCRRVLRCPT